MRERILIIKHGALGDIILATGPMKAIRAHHPHAHIVLLTTRPYAAMMAQAPFVDEVWIDPKPRAWQLGLLIKLVNAFNQPRFDWVYDLQTSERSTRYFKLFIPPKPNFSGLAKGASHRHHTPERTNLHTIDRQKQQLSIAGIDDVPAPDVSWLGDDLTIFPSPYPSPLGEGSERPALAGEGQDKLILFVAGGSAHRPEKRWPAERYAELAKRLIERGYKIALIGTSAEVELLQIIHSSDHQIINLCNQTNFAQIATLARRATYAVGNDTGPMHIIAASGCPSTVIFNTTASNPALCAPRGEHVKVVKAADMAEISVDAILSAIPRSD